MVGVILAAGLSLLGIAPRAAVVSLGLCGAQPAEKCAVGLIRAKLFCFLGEATLSSFEQRDFCWSEAILFWSEATLNSFLKEVIPFFVREAFF